MNIRFMGSPDLVERIRNIANKKAMLYDNRGSDDKRFFFEVDDRVVEQWLDLIETVDTPISIDPKECAIVRIEKEKKNGNFSFIP